MTNETKVIAKGETNSKTGAKKKWTIMVYMASSRDIRAAALESLLRMGMVGTTDHFDVLVQVDSSKPGVETKRYRLLPLPEDGVKEAKATLAALHHLNLEHIQKTLRALKQNRPKLFQERLSQSDLETVLTGAEAAMGISLRKFVENIPLSPNVKLDLKNKLLEEGVWEKVSDKPELLETLILESATKNLKCDLVEELPGADSGSSNVLSNFIDWGIGLGNEHNVVILWGHGDGLSIAGDATLKDMLTLKELANAFRGKAVDIVGFNSCFMGMLEVYHELSGQRKFGVGSEGFTPETSWPYEQILAELETKEGRATPPELAQLIVEQYEKYYHGTPAANDPGADLAACDLSRSQTVVNALESLVRVLTPQHRDAIIEARLEAQSYESDYVDLYHFCKLLGEYCNQLDVNKACSEVINALGDPLAGNPKMVMKRASLGAAVKNSHGVSIYFPSTGVSESYGELQISKTGWGQFLADYHKWIEQLEEELAA
jgi:hypothetical protein